MAEPGAPGGGRGRDRRRARLLRVWAASAGVLLLAGAVAWRLTRPDPTYRPGEELEGLTARLARELPEDRPPIRFAEVGADAGLVLRHFGGTRSGQLPEDMGSGAAWRDYDRDGWPDLYVVAVRGPLDLADGAPGGAVSRLFHNEGDGTFRDVTDEAGVGFEGWGMGAAWADVDGDGWADLAVSGYRALRLYRNRGDGTFEDRTRAAGLDGFDGFWAGLSWADYDRDGDVDLYVSGYVRYDTAAARGSSTQYDAEVPAALNPSAFEPERNLLFRNRGDGTFEEVARRAGVEGAAGRSLAATWTDFDDDGWPDLYVANDVSDNVLYRNRGDGSFEEISHPAMVADYRGAMGLATGDWDLDGDQDLFVTHWIAQENAMYSSLLAQLSEPGGGGTRRVQFRDDADRVGLGQVALDFVGWGTFFFDVDHDGLQDLFVANGHTFQDPDDPTRLVPQRDQIFWNAGPRRGFYELGPVAGEYFSEAHVGRGAAFADYDRDGDLDVVVVNHSERPALLRNDTPGGGAWLVVEPEATARGGDPTGTEVWAFQPGRIQRRRVGGQASYLSQNEPVAHFGLGDVPLDSVVVVWPDGGRQRLEGVVPGRRWRVRQGETAVVALSERERVRAFWEVYREATRARVAGRLQEAERGYAEALSLNPHHEDGLYYLAGVAIELGHFERARRALDELVARRPDGARGYARLARLHLCLDPEAPFDPAAARRAAESVRRLNRSETGGQLLLAEAHLAAGDPAAAAEVLDAVLATDPRSVAGRYLRGYARWRTGDPGGAEEDFSAALDAARSGLQGAEASGEGDTRTGTRALTASARRCAAFVPAPDSLAGLDPSAVEAAYRELARRLEEARRVH
ncbi:MAG: hypothetical protein D6701_05420 [Gemmatimonadetes bacterium]|nr:MAG: hypothetical protein D6701_05420 [Gemmatimonadota bacterium]